MITFIYNQNNTALLTCRFDNKRGKYGKNSMQSLEVIFSRYSQTQKQPVQLVHNIPIEFNMFSVILQKNSKFTWPYFHTNEHL